MGGLHGMKYVHILITENQVSFFQTVLITGTMILTYNRMLTLDSLSCQWTVAYLNHHSLYGW